LEVCLQYVREFGATEKTPTDSETLLKQLEQVRRQNYAVSFSERYEGASAIAAPIRDSRGCAQAATCIVGPETRVRQMDIAALGNAVLEASRSIEMGCQTSGFVLSALE
jgi:DNA-binding IclR family transcriptional regulator